MDLQTLLNLLFLGIIGYLGLKMIYESKAKRKSTIKKDTLNNENIHLKTILIEKEDKIEIVTKDRNALSDNNTKLANIILEKDNLYKILQEKNKYSKEYIAAQMADFITLQFEMSARILESKKHPAIKEAAKIRELKKITNEYARKLKEIEYEQNLIKTLFPELENYIDSETLSLEAENLSDDESEIDSVEKILLNYLTKEEYKKLDLDVRNQMALDKYVTNQTKKTRWQIGRDYELSVGYEYEERGLKVEYTGIENRLEDLGRDLIVHEGLTTYIIQCKNWRKEKIIHEKHITQLFGTAKQYEMEHEQGEGLFKRIVIPKIITTTTLSETAKKFAFFLGVQVEEARPFKEFPRIKCNSTKIPDGSISKIYHLPMDQQYDKTLIKLPGEYRVFTVKEAVDLGFRRAFRYNRPNQQNI